MYLRIDYWQYVRKRFVQLNIHYSMYKTVNILYNPNNSEKKKLYKFQTNLTAFYYNILTISNKYRNYIENTTHE